MHELRQNGLTTFLLVTLGRLFFFLNWHMLTVLAHWLADGQLLAHSKKWLHHFDNYERQQAQLIDIQPFMSLVYELIYKLIYCTAVRLKTWIHLP